MNIQLKPIAFTKNSRKNPIDDHWDTIESEVTLSEEIPESALDGIESFSHLELIYLFHLQEESKIVLGAEHPRENPLWPKVGIFSQRKKARPNRLGATIVKLIGKKGRTLLIQGFDGIDGTPILDIKPVFQEFLPKEKIVQPSWVGELMKDYW
ncbi:tRNA-Thr(GGU) m(6)t(6)A37 methyltransferase TsaA [Leptospira tipperaryensis]|uniref:tRNA-Thr(GGU) m(6)t(6)A37 methyltransferase TsaA n=1 Tax=Leptospira tipperaryensis TaxID=2564040 RepID=A0A1D7UVR0_9LEPT|nr:SAM-dependent methyltransferase [Leptospira tipperaryensis]AOP33658.1 tRNA-Thr(GGU) m(6)t(6)A37 methyltransferase TsaA [Leptospira tipperaryensis]